VEIKDLSVVIEKPKSTGSFYTSTVCTVQYSTVQYSTVLYSTLLYSVVQYNTVQYSIVHFLYSLYTSVEALYHIAAHRCSVKTKYYILAGTSGTKPEIVLLSLSGTCVAAPRGPEKETAAAVSSVT